jgi:hypothetical protein
MESPVQPDPESMPTPTHHVRHTEDSLNIRDFASVVIVQRASQPEGALLSTETAPSEEDDVE